MSSATSLQPEASSRTTVDASYALPHVASQRRGRGWLVRRMLAAADVVGLTLAFLVTLSLTGMADAGRLSAVEESVAFVALLPVWILAAKLNGLYVHDEARADHSTADDVVGVFTTLTVGTWIVVALALVTGFVEDDLSRILLFWAVAILLVSSARAAARAVCKRMGSYPQRTLIVGAGAVGQLVARSIRRHPEYGLHVVGFVDTMPAPGARARDGIPILADAAALPETVERHGVDRVIFAFSSESCEQLLAPLRACRRLRVQCDIVPRFFEVVGSGASVHHVGGLPLLGLGPASLPRSSQLVKRGVDVVVGAAALVLLAPFLALIALLIRIDSPGPALFHQMRVGEDDRLFRMLKFRTMVVGADARKTDVAHLNHYVANGSDARMFKAKDDPRVTRFGRFLRRYSLDELPQLVNVLKGEMSIVGPRPLILVEDAHVSDWGRGRVSVKPGITGPWQVLGRNDIPFEEMVRLDYLYVTNWSLRQDIVLMLRTIPAVVRPRDVY